MECESNGRIGAASAVLQTLWRSVVMKRKMSYKDTALSLRSSPRMVMKSG